MPNNIRQQPMWISTGDPETVNDAILQEPGQLGGRVTIVQPTRDVPAVEAGRAKTYQLVRTDSTMSVAPYRGASAQWSSEKDYMVTTASTNRNRPAGVFQNAITPGNYGFIQVEGPATFKLADAAVAGIAVGDQLIVSATASKYDHVDAGTAPTHVMVGIVASPLTVNAAAAEVVADLTVPQVP